MTSGVAYADSLTGGNNKLYSLPVVTSNAMIYIRVKETGTITNGLTLYVRKDSCPVLPSVYTTSISGTYAQNGEIYFSFAVETNPTGLFIAVSASSDSVFTVTMSEGA